MQIQKSESIQLVAKTHNYFPASFRWRGQRFDVLAVEKCWAAPGAAVRRTFRVRCQAGRFVLRQTVDGDLWEIVRWPLTLWLPRLRRQASPRFPLPKHQRRPATRAKELNAAPSGATPRAGLMSPRAGAPVPAPAKVSAPAPRSERRWTATQHRL